MARRVESSPRRGNRWGHRTTVSESTVSPGSRRGGEGLRRCQRCTSGGRVSRTPAKFRRVRLRRWGACLTRSRDVLSTRRGTLRGRASGSDARRNFFGSSIHPGHGGGGEALGRAWLRAAGHHQHRGDAEHDTGTEAGPRCGARGEPVRQRVGPAQSSVRASLHRGLGRRSLRVSRHRSDEMPRPAITPDRSVVAGPERVRRACAHAGWTRGIPRRDLRACPIGGHAIASEVHVGAR